MKNESSPDAASARQIEGLLVNYGKRDMDDITIEHLQTQKQRAAFCETVTLASTQLAPLLDIAVRRAGTYACLIIKRLQKRLRGLEVTLTGDEIRMILDLALQALAENNLRRARLEVVPAARV